ncbi:MAG TPA: hypothetical protein PLX00_08625 [Bacteroidales bacterium]|nr:hypothetical protein [Bacteroidales bacterium]
MKKLTLFTFFICLSFEMFSQSTDYAIITVYRDKDIISRNKNANLFINNVLRISVEGGNYDTLHVKQGCFDLHTNRNKGKLSKCFEPNKNYYYKIDYEYVFILGKFNLMEVTEEFAQVELKGLKRKSLKK